VTRDRFDDLDDALRALRARAQDLSRAAPRRAVDAKIRRFDPVQQVSARLELAGPERLSPTVQAGVDVRGDGSTEAFLGRVRRRVIEERGGEDTYQALGRAVRTKLG
jgi:hypothetical protein